MHLIVVESHFGNTVALADAMAAALRTAGSPTTVWMAHEAPVDLPAEIRTLVVGAPTHDGLLSTPATRKRAAGIGAKDSTDSRGVREWLETVRPVGGVDVVLFDTVRPEGGSTGSWTGSSAGSSAADEAESLVPMGTFASVSRGPSFAVEGVAGPLRPGELLRARQWALSLAALFGKR